MNDVVVAARIAAAAACAVLGLAGAGCSGDKSVPGTACVVQSDCPSPLACSYGRCHVACREARDCGPGQTCVSGASGQICLLVEESSCALNSMCPVGLVCAQDLKCRSQCEEPRDCATRTQTCVLPDKVCAEPADLTNDRLTPADVSGGGGNGGAAAGTGGAGGSGNGGGAGGSILPSGTGGATVASCGGPETASNDTFDKPTAYALGASAGACLETKDDHDFYRFTAPPDAAGGYVLVAVTDVSTQGSMKVRLLSASDTAVLEDNVTPTRGQSNYVYAAVTPGGSYLIDVSPYSFDAATPYKLTVTYKAIADTYEPNDSRFDAKPIAVGTPVSAYMFSGFPSMTVAPNDDYYKVTLGAGAVTATVDVFPTNLAPEVWLYDSLGATVKSELSTTRGSGVSVSVPSVTAGEYYVRVGTYSGFDKQAGVGVDLPDNFTRPYRLTVSQ
jgi:hypothetical protein